MAMIKTERGIGAMIEVVSGVIIQKGRILLTQRREEQDFPFTWECPGGKVESSAATRAAEQMKGLA